MEMRERKFKMLELRYNPYHDPSNGRFTSGGGSGGGGILVVPRGQKGKGYYASLNKGYSDEEIDDMYENYQKSKSNNPVYESDDEVLVVERLNNQFWGSDTDVLNAKADNEGNLYLDYAEPTRYHQQNSKTSYSIYHVKSGMSNADNVRGSRWIPNEEHSHYPSENYINGIASVGINWDKVNTVSGKTYNVKDFIKAKGFKWNSADKNWIRK